MLLEYYVPVLVRFHYFCGQQESGYQSDIRLTYVYLCACDCLTFYVREKLKLTFTIIVKNEIEKGKSYNKNMKRVDFLTLEVFKL